MRVSRNHLIYRLDRLHPPVLEAALPVQITFETADCYGGQVKSAQDTVETLDFTRVNPASGPVYLKGIPPGTTIAIHIKDIRVHSPGLMVAAPGAGVLGAKVTRAQTKVLPFTGAEIIFNGIKLPLKPMVGVIGVAPAGEGIPCRIPGSHGGNLDTRLITTGNTLYLPVQVPGALLALGDLHATMGDGEIMTTGVEVSGEVDVAVRGLPRLRLHNPLVVTPETVATIASAPTLDAAVEAAVSDMAGILQSLTGLTLNEAGMLMSACGDVQVSQIVNPLKTARLALPQAILQQLGLGLSI